MKYGAVILMSVLLLAAAAGCGSGDDDLFNGEYKPAIMVDGEIFWLAPTGNVSTIPEGCELIGQIEKISVPTELPETNWEAIGFSDDFLGADIYQSEDGETIYVHDLAAEEYIPLELTE